MDTSTYDNKISDLNNQKDTIIKEMTVIYDRFSESTTNYVINWSQKQIEKYVREEYSQTLSKNENDLKKLKTDCKNLREKLPVVVVGHLEDKKYWVHLNSNKLTKFYAKHNNYSNALNELLKEPLSIIMGQVGSILNNYNYIRLNASNCPWGSYTDGNVRYNSLQIEIAEEMESILESYIEKTIELKKIIDKITLAEIDKQKFKAIELWNKIKID